jgi:hypothetical protein
MPGTKPITHSLRNQEESRCIVWGGATEKQSRLVRGAHASMAGQQTHASTEGTLSSTTCRAASKSLTCCRIRRDPVAWVGFGKKIQSRLVRWAHAIMASQQHTCEHSGHIRSTTWRAASQSLTGCRIRSDPDAWVGFGNSKQSGAHASMSMYTSHIARLPTLVCPVGHLLSERQIHLVW